MTRKKKSSVLSHFLPVPALLTGRGVFVHQSGEFEQGELLQQEELGHRLVLHSRTGGQGGQALLAGPVQVLAHSAGHTAETTDKFTHKTHKQQKWEHKVTRSCTFLKKRIVFTYFTYLPTLSY